MDPPEPAASRRPIKRRKVGFQVVDVAAAQATLQQPHIHSTLNFRLSASKGRVGQSRSTHEVEGQKTEIEEVAETDTEVVGDIDNAGTDWSHHTTPIPTITSSIPRKRAPNRAADRLRRWLPSRDTFLEEILRWEGQGDGLLNPRCGSCGEKEGSFRCRECFVGIPRCRECIVKEHCRHPLHRVEEWLGSYYSQTSLMSLGLELQLGHGGLPCPNPGRSATNFVVADLTGFHTVHIAFCDCYDLPGGIVYHWMQLLRAGWYPATTHTPTTAFTFQLLDFFQELNLQGKTNLYDFHKTLGRITDNSGLSAWDRYRQLSECMRQWRNLTLLKRSGRAHDAGGPLATGEGSAAVECPACPQPGRNLPEEWDKAAPANLWLYTLYLMLDANFRLRLKDRGFEDIELAPGWAYIVHNPRFHAFLTKHFQDHGETIEKSTCSAEHNAILNANLRKDGYLASGVGAVLCARHALVRKNGVADLQKGEKYVNMDYLLLSTLVGVVIGLLFISYDIACQYSKNFVKRMRAFPPHMQIEIGVADLRWGIPKQHINVHGPNHSKYSFNYLPNVGRTYGEGIESGWSHMNPVSMSTKEMGPAARQELLDIHWGAWNWNKVINMGKHFAGCLREAVEWHRKHTLIFDEYSATFAAETVKDWHEAIEHWKKDPTSKPDPFEEVETHTTMRSVRLRLAKEDAADLATGIADEDEITPNMFLLVGLEIEEQQRTLRTRACNKDAIDGASLQEKRNALSRRISAWRKARAIYLPAAESLDSRRSEPSTSPSSIDVSGQSDSEVPVVPADEVNLWLPSSLPPRLLVGDLTKTLLDKEKVLRVAQADDALADIRRLRRIITGITQFKRLQVSGTGQKANARVRDIYNKFSAKIAVSAARYRVSRQALVSLDPDGDWQVRLKVLQQADIRGPGGVGFEGDPAGEGQGRHEPSWIWLVPSEKNVEPVNELTADEFSDCMRVEWARAKARMERWGEEEQLLQEEMRRVLAFFQWKADWWRDQAPQRQGVNADISSGLAAYAEKQASLLEQLIMKFTDIWLPLFGKLGLSPEWGLQYTGSSKKGPASGLEDEGEESVASDEDL